MLADFLAGLAGRTWEERGEKEVVATCLLLRERLEQAIGLREMAHQMGVVGGQGSSWPRGWWLK